MVSNQTSQYGLLKKNYLSAWGIFQYIRAILQFLLPMDHPVAIRAVLVYITAVSVPITTVFIVPFREVSVPITEGSVPMTEVSVLIRAVSVPDKI